MAKRRWRWVTRDPEGEEVTIWENARPIPRLYYNEWESRRNDGPDICCKHFKATTGLTVPTDRPIKVEFSARVIE